MENSDRLYVGIDAGAVSLNCVVIDEGKEIVFESPYQRHLGKVEVASSILARGLLEMLQKDQDIAVARSLTDPLYQLWEFLDFDRKWRDKYVPAPLAKQNVGQISGPDGIKGVLEYTLD